MTKGVQTARERVQTAQARMQRTARQSVRPNRAKLLISIVNRGDDGKICELLNDFSVALTFLCMGKGTARS